jgi:formylglycine-generating enzyme required for sulfatase activity
LGKSALWIFFAVVRFVGNKLKKFAFCILLVANGSLVQAAETGDVLTEARANMDFVYITPGQFLMGSPEQEANRYDDEEQHHVSIPHGFWIGKYEVTFDQYQIFSQLTKYPDAYDNGWGRGQRPAINVNWFEAEAFAKWLSNETGHKYRLPTEAEWEYAAKAGTTTAYSFGDNPEELAAYAWNGAQGERQTHPVGLKKPNPWGLYDIHGNVWEWTSSEYAEKYDGKELVAGAFDTKAKRAVARGGSWYFYPKSLRSADRRLFAPDFRRPYIGFRLVREE